MKKKTVSLLMVISMLLLIFPTAVLAEEAPELRSVVAYHSNISASGNTVSIRGTTSSGLMEDEISVTSILQVRSGSQWYSVYTWSNSNNNYYTVSTSGMYTVSPGTYRVYSIHKTTKNGVTDTKYSYSNEVSVS